MYKIFVLILILFFVPILSWSNSMTLDADKSVVRILVKSKLSYGSGTGFVINGQGFVATNNHVVGDAIIIRSVSKDSNGNPQNLEAKLIWKSEDLDLAIIKVEGLVAPPLQLKFDLPEKGSKVTSIGYPGMADKAIGVNYSNIAFVESTFSEGIVGRVVESPWETGSEILKIIQHSAAVNSGNSGGPLINTCGQVVGINTGKALGTVEKNGSDVANVNQTDGVFYASHISYLIKNLLKLKIDYVSSQSDCLLDGNPNTINTPQEYTNNNVVIFISSLAVIISILSVLFFLRKSNVSVESYTNFQKRSRNAEFEKQVSAKISCYFLVDKKNKNSEISYEIVENSSNKKSIYLGRDDSICSIIINDKSVSRNHAEFFISGDLLKVRDMNSTNGTWVNSTRISGDFQLIHPDQVLKFGNVELILKQRKK